MLEGQTLKKEKNQANVFNDLANAYVLSGESTNAVCCFYCRINCMKQMTTN